jgi:multiple sugar transport system substrate-binding protein
MSRRTGPIRVRTLATGLVAATVLLAAVGAASASPAHHTTAKAITLTIGANAVVGGKNDLEATWITNYIIPNFEKQMAAAGDPVDVHFQGTGVADEAYKTQLALDLKTGGGADIVDIDDIWVGEFAQAGYIKPLTTIVGPSVNSWDGWSNIPKAVRADIAFEGKQYGVPTGPDSQEA